VAEFFDLEMMKMDWIYPYNIIMLARKS